MIKNREGIKIEGRAYIQGLTKEKKTIFEYYSHNMIVNSGLLAATRMLSKSVSFPASGDYTITKFDVGTSSVATSASFTSLQGTTLSGRPSVPGGLNDPKMKITQVTYPLSTSVRFSFLIDFADFNGFDIKELALYTENNTMFNRVVFPSGFKKDNSFSVSGYSEINFSTSP